MPTLPTSFSTSHYTLRGPDGERRRMARLTAATRGLDEMALSASRAPHHLPLFHNATHIRAAFVVADQPAVGSLLVRALPFRLHIVTSPVRTPPAPFLFAGPLTFCLPAFARHSALHLPFSLRYRAATTLLLATRRYHTFTYRTCAPACLTPRCASTHCVAHHFSTAWHCSFHSATLLPFVSLHIRAAPAAT